MQPNQIKILGFKFIGGNLDGCMFLEHPTTIKDTLVAIKTAKAMIKDSGSTWVELTMIAQAGQKEFVKLYAEQEAKVESPKVDPPKEPNIYKVSIDEDPYQWSNGK